MTQQPEQNEKGRIAANRFVVWAARCYLRFTGWKPATDAPTTRRFVLIAAPHTSNWDLTYLLAICWTLGLDVSWMGKHTIFRWPFGGLMEYMGGIRVRRHVRENSVEQMAAAFVSRSRLALAVPVEGTRSRAHHWKSGFYHIARAANVPIVLGFLDYSKKSGGFGPEIVASGNVSEDMDRIRAFYNARMAKFPEHFGPVRLKEEA